METCDIAVEPAPPLSAARPKLRWYQFRLRSLLLLTVVCALASSGWVYYDRARKKREQHEAAALLQQAFPGFLSKDAEGNIVAWETCGLYRLDGRLAELRRMPYLQSVDIRADSIDQEAAESLSKLAPNEHFSLTLFEAQGTCLAHVCKIRSLRGLECTFVSASDADIAHLTEMTSLERLYLSLWDGEVTDAGLCRLRQLKNLRELTIAVNWTTDLTWLTEMKQLELLELEDSALTENARIHLALLPKLRDVTLRDCFVRDHHLSELGAVPQLRKLDLRGTSLTDLGISHLRGLTGLEKLDLRGTKITDAGLEHVAAMRSLKEVDITRTPVTPDGLSRLRDKRPDLKVRE